MRDAARSRSSSSGDWVDVCGFDALEEEIPEGIRIRGNYIALFRIGDAVYATSGFCTHAQADLCNGYVEGDVVECPLHQARFHIPTGRVLSEPADRDIEVFPTEIRDGRVLVRLREAQ